MKCPECGSENVAIMLRGFACLDCGASKPRIPKEAIDALRDLAVAEADAEADNHRLVESSKTGTEK